MSLSGRGSPLRDRTPSHEAQSLARNMAGSGKVRCPGCGSHVRFAMVAQGQARFECDRSLTSCGCITFSLSVPQLRGLIQWHRDNRVQRVDPSTEAIARG